MAPLSLRVLFLFAFAAVLQCATAASLFPNGVYMFQYRLPGGPLDRYLTGNATTSQHIPVKLLTRLTGVDEGFQKWRLTNFDNGTFALQNTKSPWWIGIEDRVGFCPSALFPTCISSRKISANASRWKFVKSTIDPDRYHIVLENPHRDMQSPTLGHTLKDAKNVLRATLNPMAENPKMTFQVIKV
ncbi:hypothetical protein BGZ94_000860 [Podila epigama]|nr:hypothetical protein BGZ94_000860 [Podila epigama]